MNTVVESNGLAVSDLFLHSKIIEDLKDRDEKNLFEENLYNLKNLIYKNIYNNLTYIYKSKGTDKSFRNLIRSFGVDDELIKSNLYANNTTFTLQNNKRSTTTRKKVINLATPDSYDVNIYNTQDVDGAFSGSSYIAPTVNGAINLLPWYAIPLTFETEIYFPKKLEVSDENYTSAQSTEISLFGAYTSLYISNSDYTVDTSADKYGFEAYLVKADRYSTGGYFKFVSLLTNEVLTSSYYTSLFEGEKWNFAVRIKPPFGNIDLANYNLSQLPIMPSTGSYRLELYGVNTDENFVKNEFTLTSSALTEAQVSGSHLQAKRFYLGARKANLTGTVLNETEILVSSARFWLDEITNDELKEHSKDTFNYGVTSYLKKPYDTYNINVNKGDLLAFDWQFDQVTSSDNSGVVYVVDSKGRNEYESIFNVNTAYRHPAKISETAPNNKEIVKKQYTLSARPQLPENLYSTDTINIFGESDYYFTRDSRPVNFFWSFEKSMYQTISEDILNMFAGISEFNDLIGDPLNRYRVVNRELNYLKTIFFKKLLNTPSVEKFTEYYKWIDESIGYILKQLVPASIDSSNNVRNVIESHALQASSHTYFPNTLKKVKETSYGQIKGIKELKYNWQSGHAPDDISAVNSDTVQTASALWLNRRAERNSSFFTNPSAAAAERRQRMLDSSNNDTNKPAVRLFDEATVTIYSRIPYADRKLARAYDIVGTKVKSYSDSIDIYDVKNIQNTTSSAAELRPLLSGTADSRVSLYNKPNGNFINKYEVFNGASRENNNKYFVDITGSQYPEVASTTISGVVDRQLPQRTPYKSIFVSKFSPAGGAEVDSRGSLDAASETFSPYTSINNRNIVQRRYLDKWSAVTSSISATNPSYHKVYKNRLNMAGLDFFDNKFVTHQIPRSDYNYSWITASATSRDTSNGPYVSIYPNISIGSLSILSSSFESGVNIDFVGLNSNYSSVVNISDTLISSSSDLHTTLLKRGLAYGYPMWKQLQSLYNPIGKYYKNNNILAPESTAAGVSSTFSSYSSDSSKQINRFIIKSNRMPLFREPAVEWNRSIEEELEIDLSADPNLESNSTPDLDTITANTDYHNEINYFANQNINNLLNLQQKADDNTGYRKLFNLYGPTWDTVSDVKLVKIFDRQIIFPKRQFVTLKEIRTRPNYTETAGTGSTGRDRNISQISTTWRDNFSDRQRTLAVSSSTGTGSINSLNYAFLSSSLANGFEYRTKYLPYNPTSSVTPQIRAIVTTSGKTDTVWSMDKDNNVYFDYSPGKEVLKYYVENTKTGEIAPYDEYEIRKFILRPSGTLIDTQLVSSLTGAAEYVYGLQYNNNYFRVLPRPQYLFINKLGSFREEEKGAYDLVYSTFTYNNGMKYYSDALSSNKPFFDNIEEFNKDIKVIGQNYGLVPEYNISNDIEYYYSLRGANFSKPRRIEYLSLRGETNLTQNTNNIIGDFILQKYYTTDALSNKIAKENKSTVQNNKSSLNIKVKGVKKLLPYKGFYPQDRSVQVVDLFRNSFIGLSTQELMTGTLNVDSEQDKCPVDQQIASLIQPLFAPGILYNTIKASIAVDWPTFITTSHNYSGSRPDFYGTGPLVDYDNNIATDIPLVIDSNYSYRFPFESILDINNAIPQQFKASNYKLPYLNPTYYTKDSVSGSDLSEIRYPFYPINDPYSSINQKWLEKNNLYTLAINNYFAEIVNFFIRDNSLTTFNSKKQSEITEQLKGGKTYFMDVVLYRGLNQKQILDKTFESIFDISAVVGGGQTAEINIQESSYYGPPTRWYNRVIAEKALNESFYNNGSAYQYIFSGLSPFVNILGAAYAPHAPPYYYGKSIARISYTPAADEAVSIKKILAGAQIQYINELSVNDPLADLNSPAFTNIMPISASFNLKQIKNDGIVTFTPPTELFGITQPTTVTKTFEDKTDIWSIQTKFETPLLNFNNDLNKSINTVETEVFSDGSEINEEGQVLFSKGHIISTIGLWSGYGAEPAGSNEGIYASIEDSYNVENNLTGSLRRIMGFDRVPTQQIGKIASEKQISEALVIIPYTNTKNTGMTTDCIAYENGEERYFSVDQTILDSALKDSQNNSQMKKTYQLMDKYIIPPHLDWKQDPNIKPFVMFIAEFEHILDKQDLIDIWQGLMPTISKIAEKDEVNISINLNESAEFFHGKELPDDVRFKVFKVKRKANISYYDLTSDSGDDNKFKFKFGTETFARPKYSYNWPYDYFSLVDRVQIEAGIEILSGSEG
jgi:hypothetical protein